MHQVIQRCIIPTAYTAVLTDHEWLVVSLHRTFFNIVLATKSWMSLSRKALGTAVTIIERLALPLTSSRVICQRREQQARWNGSWLPCTKRWVRLKDEDRQTQSNNAPEVTFVWCRNLICQRFSSSCISTTSAVVVVCGCCCHGCWRRFCSSIVCSKVIVLVLVCRVGKPNCG